MEVSFTSVHAFGLERSLEVLNEGFSDYIVPIHLEIDRFRDMARADSVDFELSQVLVTRGEAAGVALIARRGNLCRLAAMSVRPEFRGGGNGRKLLDQLLKDARARRDSRMMLEVIESNEAAVRLYESAGFKAKRRLLSFGLDEGEGNGGELGSASFGEIADVVDSDGLEDLPWQASAETAAQFRAPSVAVRLGDAYAAISNPVAPKTAIQCLIVRQESRGQGQASRLMLSLFQKYPGRRWLVPAICPAELGGFFEKLDFSTGELSQLQMSIEL